MVGRGGGGGGGEGGGEVVCMEVRILGVGFGGLAMLESNKSDMILFFTASGTSGISIDGGEYAKYGYQT